MQYQVTKQYERGGETPCGDFKTLGDARNFIRESMMQDAGMRIRITYRIFESFEMIEEYDPTRGQIPGGAEDAQSQSASGQGKGAGFRPTPLNSAPRPAGIPHNWVKDDDDDEDKDK